MPGCALGQSFDMALVRPLLLFEMKNFRRNGDTDNDMATNGIDRAALFSRESSQMACDVVGERLRLTKRDL